MAQSANGNVLPLGSHPRARARLTPQESRQLLAGCREMALSRITAALASMLDRVEGELFELAEKAAEPEARDAYLEARNHSRTRRADIEAGFRRHFLEVFNRKVTGAPAASPPPDAVELALVDGDALEEAIAVSEMSRRLQAACGGELFALSRRMGFILERPELPDEANPMSPETICAALRGACGQIQVGFRVRLTLLRQFERHAEAELQRIYRDLNTHLVQQQILPEVKPGVRRNAEAPRPIRTPPRPSQPADTLAALAQLLGAAGPGAAADATPAAPLAAPAAFLDALTRMHREALAAASHAPADVVRSLKAAPEAVTLPPLDALTIDLVGMLFDYVFEDEAIPSSVKALLGRLQIPMLKAALLDRAFFCEASHPARRLLDGLAESALGLDEDDTRGVETLAMIDGVVDRVLGGFESDLSIFETVAAEVAAFLEARDRLEDDIVQRSAQLVEARERREIADLVAHGEVHRRLDARAFVPAAVRSMLLEDWTRVLCDVFLAEGEGSAAWQRFVLAMEDLLWSVEPKSAADDRRRLLGMLPSLLRELQAGLHRAGIGEAEREAFMAALVDCHAAAVKAGLRGLAAMPPAAAPSPVEPPAIEHVFLPAGDLQLQEIRLKPARGQPPVRNVFTRTGIHTNVQRGAWVEFAQPVGTPVRAKLTWVSPNRGVHLFTNPLAATAAVSISAEALAEQMRLGRARLLDAAPLVERAVGSMLATLRDRKGAAGSPSP